MNIITNPIAINYSDESLRILVEEYVTQQRGAFTLKSVCSYVLFWAMEDGHTTGVGNDLYESDKLAPADCVRISAVLDKIVREGRVDSVGSNVYRKL